MPISVEFEHIETAVQALPLQSRTMLQLLLLQYVDVTQDEIDYMATDQPDSSRHGQREPDPADPAQPVDQRPPGDAARRPVADQAGRRPPEQDGGIGCS